MGVELHSIGPWHTQDGSMFFEDNSFFLDEDIAILVDIDEDGVGTLLKIGTTKNLQEYFDTAMQKCRENNCEWLGETWKLISFNVKFEANEELGLPEFAPQGYNLTVDEICTMINWFVNCSCQNMRDFFNLPLDEIKAKLCSLQRIGY